MELTASLKAAISGFAPGTAKPDAPVAAHAEDRESDAPTDRHARLSDRLLDAIVDEDGVRYNAGSLDDLQKQHDDFLKAMKCDHDWQAIYVSSGGETERIASYFCTICKDIKPA